MRFTRSTAVAAVVALFIGLMVSHGPWWARGSPSQASAAPAATTPAPGPAPAPGTPAASPAPDAQSPPPAPAPVPAAAPPATKVPADAIGPLTGANVTVYLRADAVGMQFTGANMEVRNLASRRGAFVRCDDYWFILKNESQEIWVPRSSIALVEMRS